MQKRVAHLRNVNRKGILSAYTPESDTNISREEESFKSDTLNDESFIFFFFDFLKISILEIHIFSNYG